MRGAKRRNPGKALAHSGEYVISSFASSSGEINLSYVPATKYHLFGNNLTLAERFTSSIFPSEKSDFC